MRRIAVVLVLLMAFGLLVSPATAEEPIQVVVPSYVSTDGSLDAVVLTGHTPATVTVVNCLPDGEYQVFAAVLVDKSQKVAGLFDGVIATADVRGNLGDFRINGICYEPDGTSYRKYIQVP